MGGLAIAHTPAAAHRSLIGRVLGGDPTAERELYDAQVDRVYRLAYRMVGDPHLAEEYTQDTFVRVFGRLGEFRGEASLSTWITAIAISVIYNGLRRLKRFREREVELDETTPADRAGAVEPDLKARLAQAIESLPVGYRTVFTMHDIEGYTHDEIALALGIRDGTSKAQLSRARARLRTVLADFGGDLP